jgi:hypothetical protein
LVVAVAESTFHAVGSVALPELPIPSKFSVMLMPIKVNETCAVAGLYRKLLVRAATTTSVVRTVAKRLAVRRGRGWGMCMVE